MELRLKTSEIIFSPVLAQVKDKCNSAPYSVVCESKCENFIYVFLFDAMLNFVINPLESIAIEIMTSYGCVYAFERFLSCQLHI